MDVIRSPGLGSLVTDFLATSFGQEVKAYVTAQLTGYASDYVQGNIVSVEFRTAYTAPITWSGVDLANLIKNKEDVKEDAPLAAAPKKSSILSRLKPTLIIKLKSGEKIVAPYGAVSAGIWQTNRRNLALIGIGALVVYTALVFSLGYNRGGKRA
jgi:hypothetical protein